MDDSNSTFRQWLLDELIDHLRTYFARVPQPPDSEIVPLLVYKDASSQQSSVVSSASTRQPNSTQAQSEDEVTKIYLYRTVFK